MSAATALLLVVQCAVTGAMTGIIWFVQITHYPLLPAVGTEEFVAYEIKNTRLTSRVVGPLMLIEAAAAVLIMLVRAPGVSSGLAATGILLLLLIYVSTAILQVPAHSVLSERFDRRTVDRLVKTNWVRTLAWSARLLVAAAMVLAAIPHP